MPSNSRESKNLPSILTISGWGQAPGSLLPLFPEATATALDYSKYDGVEELFRALERETSEVVVGWSLGGQLAVRAVAAGHLKPKLLVLIAAPFQFISSKDMPYGMSLLQFQAFEHGFALTPGIILRKFASMMTFQDSHAREISALLAIDEHNHADWLRWLRELRKFSCKNLDFSTFPRTLIIHGERDIIVDVRQAHEFAQRLPNARVELFPHAGHAPHLHDVARIWEFMLAEI